MTDTNTNIAESSLTVKTIEGESHVIPYLDNMTGKQVKNRIKAITGYGVDMQSLVVGGREIENDKKLADLDVNKGQVV
jgi:hypothetical protein